MSDIGQPETQIPEHEKDSIYQEGYDDGYDGYQVCPYANGSPKYMIWLEGFNVGKADASSARD